MNITQMHNYYKSSGLWGVLLLFLITQIACLPSNDNSILESATANLDYFLGQLDKEILDAELAEIDDSLEVWGLSEDVNIENKGGVRYIIQTPGTGDKPQLDSFISIDYSGKLLREGTVFDSGENLQLYVYQFIAGFQTGLPNIQEGSTITLYIPASLGYGSQAVDDGAGTTIIPANSNLIFDLMLTDVE